MPSAAPGQRAFYIQARTEQTQLTVLVEKEQVDLLSTEAVAFLDKIADKYPELPFDLPSTQSALRRAHRPALPGPADRPGLRPRPRARADRARANGRKREARKRPTTTRRRGLRGAHLRNPGAGPGDGGPRRRSRRRWPSAVPAVRAADGPVRAPVSSLELTPAELRDALETADLEVVGRMRYSSNATFLVEATVDGVQLAAIYKPRRGERPLWDFPRGHAVPARGRGLRALRRARAGTSCRSPCCATVRSASARCSATSTTIPTSTSSRCATTTRRASASSRRSTCWRTTPTARAGTACTTRSNDIVVGIDHGLCFHEDDKLRTVIWEYAGERLADDAADDVCRVVAELHGGPLHDRLGAAPRRRRARRRRPSRPGAPHPGPAVARRLAQHRPGPSCDGRGRSLGYLRS